MSQKLVVIVAVTGRQGSSVAHTFLSQPGWRVRGLTRDPSSASAKALGSKGVELVKADLNTPSSLAAAFAGATLIFGVTDFWSNLKDPSLGAKVTPEKHIFTLAEELELEQGKNLIDAVGQTVGLSRFVFSSLPDPHSFDSTKTKYENLRHVFAKPRIEEYLVSKYPDTAAKTSFLYLSYYMENWNAGYPTSISKGEDGKLHVYYPFDGTTQFYHTPASHDTGPAVLALYGHKAGVKFFLGSDVMGWKEYLDIVSEKTGIENGGVINVGKEGFEGFIPGPLGPELYENMLLIENLSTVDLKNTYLLPADLGVKTTSWKEFVAQSDFSSLTK